MTLDRSKLNFSFAGCGFLGIYHFGVAACLRRYVPHLLSSVSGASAGALAGSCIVGDVPVSEAAAMWIHGCVTTRDKVIGALSPSSDVSGIVRGHLENIVPTDGHLRVNGRVSISLTRVRDMKNVVVSHFDSRAEFIDALICAITIPFFVGLIPPRFRGERYIDGGFSNNLLIPNEHTVTVSPFGGEADICPRDGPTMSPWVMEYNNMSLEFSSRNMVRLRHAIVPPRAKRLAALCQEGYQDTLRWLVARDLVACQPCHLTSLDEAFFSGQARGEEQENSEPEDDQEFAQLCAECELMKDEAGTESLPEAIEKTFDEAIRTGDKRSEWQKRLGQYRIVKEARNMPWRDYLNQPADVFFTLEIEPRKLSTRKTSLGGGYAKTEMMRYRFVTKTLRRANDICDFSEKFLAQLSKANLKDYKIRFTAFDQDRYGNPTELGSTTLTFDDFRDFTNHKLILSCSLKEPVIKRGELLIGLCYLPTAERISVNIMKVTNMNPYYSYGTITKQSICYVRVFLLRGDTGKVLKRKKTTYQRLGSTGDQPIFNETLVFDMPPSELIQTVLLVMVCLTDKVQGGGDQSPSPPSLSHLASKRHSTPENHHLRPPEVTDNRQHHRHSVDDAIFHYGDNMSLGHCSRSSSGVFDSAGSSRRGSVEPPTSSPAPPSTDTVGRSKDHVVGKVAFGFSVKTPGARTHWEKMIRAPRTIASEWHNLN